MPLTAGEKWGWGLLLGGLALAGGGGIALAVARNRRNAALSGPLGHLVRQNRSETSGMTVKEYRSAMPEKERVEHIQNMVAKAVRDPDFIKLARSVVQQCGARDRHCEAKAIHDWVKHNVIYRSDPAPHTFVDEQGRRVHEAVDLYASPQRTVELRSGDCDDHASLNAALAIAVGVDARFRLTSPEKNGEATHIFARLSDNYHEESFKSCDTTLPHGSFGSEAAYASFRDYPA